MTAMRTIAVRPQHRPPTDCPFVKTPAALQAHVFSFLDLQGVRMCETACKTFQTLLAAPVGDQVWRPLIMQKFGLSAQEAMEQAGSKRYKLLFDRTANMKNYHETSFSTPHGAIVQMAYQDGRLFTRHFGGVRLWDIGSQKLLASLPLQDISSFVLDKQHLYMGDSLGQLWKCNTTLQNLAQFAPPHGHNGEVTCMAIYREKEGPLLITGSADCTAKFWRIADGSLVKTLLGHTLQISCLEATSTQLFTGSYDGEVNVWSLPEGKLLRLLITDDVESLRAQCNGIVSNRIMSISVQGNRIFATDELCSIWNWDSKSGRCLTMDDVPAHSRVLGADRLSIIYSNNEARIVNLTNRDSSYTPTIIPGGCSSITLSGAKLFTGDTNGLIRIFDFAAPDRRIWPQLADCCAELGDKTLRNRETLRDRILVMPQGEALRLALKKLYKALPFKQRAVLKFKARFTGFKATGAQIATAIRAQWPEVREERKEEKKDEE